jgi:glyoxylase I family protein
MLKIKEIDHIAVICSDYQKSKIFYTQILGFQILNENYRAKRSSMKLDLQLHNKYIIELFSFPNPPERKSQPEACGLRHLALQVEDLDESIDTVQEHTIAFEPIRIDEFTGRRFLFLFDPDGLPIELVESVKTQPNTSLTEN